MNAARRGIVHDYFFLGSFKLMQGIDFSMLMCDNFLSLSIDHVFRLNLFIPCTDEILGQRIDSRLEL